MNKVWFKEFIPLRGAVQAAPRLQNTLRLNKISHNLTPKSHMKKTFSNRQDNKTLPNAAYTLKKK